MKTIIRNIVAVVACTSMLTSCSMWNNETNGTVLGGLGGAILGGALGEVLGGAHGSDVGANIGAVIGAAAGASAGREKDRQEAYEYYYGTNNNRNEVRYESDYSENYQKENSYYDEQSGLTYVRINSDCDISFSSNSSTITGGSIKALNNIYRKLRQCDYDIYIYGSADSYEHNANQLSNARANNVKRWLVNNGISSRRIHAVALGNSNPIGNNNTERGKALNRSVEIFITK